MKNKSTDAPLQLLGNISAQQFLDEYWQKKPLLIRRAFGKGFSPLTNHEILTLAGYEEAESRIALSTFDMWQLDHGPFPIDSLKRLKKNPNAKWTVLVQDVQHFSFEAHLMLSNFRFLPQSRIDDLMVSYAVKGGGVGPHFDSYDVFLLQGSGKRRWQISAQKDLTLVPDMPLKILKRFRSEEEWVLEEGDMLYLPPHYAHNGVAETDDCVTWSIGFRAPSNQELLDAFVDDLRDNLKVDGRLIDAKRVATNVNNHAEVDPQMRAAFQQTLSTTLGSAISKASLDQFTGRYLTEPKSHVDFLPPEKMMTLANFTKRALKKGLALDLRSRMLYDDVHAYVNGEKIEVAKKDRAIFSEFANTRYASPETMKSASSKAFEAFHAHWARGYWHLANGTTRWHDAEYALS